MDGVSSTAVAFAIAGAVLLLLAALSYAMSRDAYRMSLASLCVLSQAAVIVFFWLSIGCFIVAIVGSVPTLCGQKNPLFRKGVNNG